MTDQERKVMETALEALEWHVSRTRPIEKTTEAMDALRQALAQPEQDDEAYGYAKYLAECIWKKHYKEESPHWRPSDNTLSVLTQIDNMTCGLEKAQPDNTSDFATRSADSAESFCDTHCVHTDHHPDCKLAQPEQEPDNWWDDKEYVKSRFGDSAKIVGVRYGLPTGSFKQPQPSQEPVAWLYDWKDGVEIIKDWITSDFETTKFNCAHNIRPLYATPISEPIKERISEPVENLEPVATVTSSTGNPDIIMSWWHEPALPVGTKLYTAPPKREFFGLTDEEIAIVMQRLKDETSLGFARAIEAKLKEKNGHS